MKADEVPEIGFVQLYVPKLGKIKGLSLTMTLANNSESPTQKYQDVFDGQSPPRYHGKTTSMMAQN
jgi:hypothetical protein